MTPDDLTHLANKLLKARKRYSHAKRADKQDREERQKGGWWARMKARLFVTESEASQQMARDRLAHVEHEVSQAVTAWINAKVAEAMNEDFNRVVQSQALLAALLSLETRQSDFRSFLVVVRRACLEIPVAQKACKTVASSVFDLAADNKGTVQRAKADVAEAVRATEVITKTINELNALFATLPSLAEFLDPEAFPTLNVNVAFTQDGDTLGQSDQAEDALNQCDRAAGKLSKLAEVLVGLVGKTGFDVSMQKQQIAHFEAPFRRAALNDVPEILLARNREYQNDPWVE